MFENDFIDKEYSTHLIIEKGDYVCVRLSEKQDDVIHGLFIRGIPMQEWVFVECSSSPNFFFTGAPQVVYIRNFQTMRIIEKRADVELRRKHDKEWFERLIGTVEERQIHGNNNLQRASSKRC